MRGEVVLFRYADNSLHTLEFYFYSIGGSNTAKTKHKQLFFIILICHFKICFIAVTKIFKTFNNGSLGSRIDEERSEMRYVMWIAEFRESSNLWTHIAPLGIPGGMPVWASFPSQILVFGCEWHSVLHWVNLKLLAVAVVAAYSFCVMVWFLYY